MLRQAVVLAFVVGSVAVLSAQEPSAPSPTPAFEVASVKPSPPRDPAAADTIFGNGFYRIPTVGTVVISNIPLRDIIARAYGVYITLDRFVLVGGPSDILSSRFDITAKPPEGASPGTTLAMLQNLLADRFKLKIRRETRQVPLYVLTVAQPNGKLGPELRSSGHDCSAVYAAGRTAKDPNPPRDAKGRGLCWSNYDYGPGTIGVRFAGPMSALVARSLQPWVDRPVVDRTELVGNYEWTVTFSRDPLRGGEAPPIDVAVREQLGLKLEREIGPFEVLVIDSVERPTPD